MSGAEVANIQPILPPAGCVHLGTRAGERLPGTKSSYLAVYLQSLLCVFLFCTRHLTSCPLEQSLLTSAGAGLGPGSISARNFRRTNPVLANLKAGFASL